MYRRVRGSALPGPAGVWFRPPKSSLLMTSLNSAGLAGWAALSLLVLGLAGSAGVDDLVSVFGCVRQGYLPELSVDEYRGDILAP